MHTLKSVLVIEDDPTAALLLKEFLAEDSRSVNVVETGYEALEEIQREAPEIILLDLGLPDVDGLDLIADIRRHASHSEIIVVTGEKSADSALKAIHCGARDYIMKPIDRDRLLTSVQNAFERITLARELRTLKQDEKSNAGFHGLVGRSAAMLDLYKAIENLAECDERVFITGEHGVGKTLCAETIHRHSSRKDKPFVKLNCLTLGRDFSASEFSKNVDAAEGGTLYFSYVTELCDEAQEAVFELLDSDKDIRIMCSTPRSITDKLKDGTFRQDLFYRLNVLPLEMTPLRQRGEDVSLLANVFLKEFSQKQDKNFEEFDDMSVKILESHHWPGNVRELRNVVQSIVRLNNEGTVVTSSMLPKELVQASHVAANENDESSRPVSVDNLFEGMDVVPIPELEQMAIKHALDVCDGNVQEAALKLKISPATLYRKRPVSK